MMLWFWTLAMKFTFGLDKVPMTRRKRAFAMAENYVKTDPTERTLDSTVILRVTQVEEPAAFTAIFPAWNPDMWQLPRRAEKSQNIEKVVKDQPEKKDF
nr:gelsolin, cytoplasmic-like [Procambarus clarkii]